MSTVMPFLEYRRDTIFSPAMTPGVMSHVSTPTPTRTPKDKTDHAQNNEQHEQSDQEAEDADVEIGQVEVQTERVWEALALRHGMGCAIAKRTSGNRALVYVGWHFLIQVNVNKW